MKGKTEILVLAIIIAVAVVYLVTRTDDRETFDIPKLATVATDSIDRVEIKGPKAALTLTRKDSGWIMTPDDLPVDAHKMDGILETISTLTLTDLVSQAKAYDRYDLGTERQIAISAWSGDRQVRSFAMGKSAPTFSHTYVTVADDPVVYHARGDFRRKFDRGPEDLRDKVILKFETAAVQQMTLKGVAKDTLTLTRAKPGSKETETKPENAESAPPNTGWTTNRGNTPPPGETNRLLMTLHQLECQKFVTTPPTGDPLIQVVVEAGDAPTVLDIFPKTDAKADAYPARSSQNDSAFTLPTRIVTTLRTLAQTVFEVPPSEIKEDPATTKKAGS